jgi:hypothetical protein
MKTALQILVAIASVFTLLMAGFGLSNNPADKRTAARFMILAIGAWVAYILLLLRSKHVQSHNITPKEIDHRKEIEATPQRIEKPALPLPESPKTNLTVAPPVERKPERPIYGPPDPKKPVNNIPFETGYGLLWTEYTEDTFHDVIWRWHYKPDIDNTPRNISPYCPECESPNLLQWTVERHLNWYTVDLKCRFHPQYYFIRLDHNPYSKPFESIKKLIQQKLDDGTWLDVVDRQRRARGQSPLGRAVSTPPALGEIKDLILLALWEDRPSYEFYAIQDAVSFKRHLKGKPEVDKSTMEYHLHDLDKQEYIQTQQARIKSYSLTQKGRKYVMENLPNKD